MKKIIVLAAFAAALASCADADKCKCTIKVGNLTYKDQIIERPSDISCSDIKVEDINGEVIDIDLTKLATVKCKNHHE